ncbi:MAG TPA: ATP-binding protein [Kineosporiaceae bacterium]|nr:ATP-binding protein [Kineosporiaceae bacterium]
MSQSPAQAASVVSWPSEAVEVALRRMASLVVGAWLIGFGVTTVSEGSLRYPVAVLGLLGLGLASSLVVALWRPADGRLLVVVAAATAMTVLLVADLGAGGLNALLLYWLTGIVAVCAGLLLSPRGGLGVGLSFGVAFSTVLLLRALPHDGPRVAVTASVASLGIAVCDGAAGILLARALRGLGRAADVEMSRAEHDRATQQQAVRDRWEAVRLAARLHDGVVNTLSAVAVRGDGLDPDAVRRACAGSADEADRIAAGGGHPTAAPGALLPWQRADETPGTLPEVVLDGVTPEEFIGVFSRLPSPVAGALSGGIREALVNVARHSGRDWAWIEAGLRPVLEISVRDDGAGFTGDPVPGRGLAVSVIDQCAAVGVDVRIRSAPGRGTDVRFRYDPATQTTGKEAVLDAEQLLAGVRQPFATQLACCLLALCLCLTLVASGAMDGSQSPGSWLGLALLGGVTWVGAAGSRQDGWMGAHKAAWVVLAVPALVLLPGLGLPGCARVEMAWWGSEGALVPVVLLVFLSRRWWPTGLAVAVFGASLAVLEWSVRRRGCASPMVSGLLDLPVVVAVAYFRASLTRLALRASAANADARRTRLAESGARSAHRAWRTHLALVLRDAAELLRAVAEGELAPDREDVRRRCLLAETHLRQLTQLDPDLDALEEQWVTVLASAHRTGVRMVLRTGARAAPDPAAAAAVGTLLGAVVGACAAGDTITVSRLGPSPFVTITAPAAAASVCAQLCEPTRAAGWSPSWTELGEQCLIELQKEPA